MTARLYLGLLLTAGSIAVFVSTTKRERNNKV